MITFYSKEGLGLREGDWKILAIGMNLEWMAKRKRPLRFYPNRPFPVRQDRHLAVFACCV